MTGKALDAHAVTAALRCDLHGVGEAQEGEVELGGQGRWGQGARATQWQLAYYRSQLADEILSVSNAYGQALGTTNYAGGTRLDGTFLAGRINNCSSRVTHHAANSHSGPAECGGADAGL